MKDYERFVLQWSLGLCFFLISSLFFFNSLNALGLFFLVVGVLLVIIAFTRFRIHTAYFEEEFYVDDL